MASVQQRTFRCGNYTDAEPRGLRHDRLETRLVSHGSVQAGSRQDLQVPSEARATVPVRSGLPALRQLDSQYSAPIYGSCSSRRRYHNGEQPTAATTVVGEGPGEAVPAVHGGDRAGEGQTGAGGQPKCLAPPQGDRRREVERAVQEGCCPEEAGEAETQENEAGQ